MNELTDQEILQRLIFFVEATKTSSCLEECGEYLSDISEMAEELGTDTFNDFLYTHMVTLTKLGLEIKSSKFDFTVIDEPQVEGGHNFEDEEIRHEIYGEPVTEICYTVAIFDYTPSNIHISGVMSIHHPSIYWSVILEPISPRDYSEVEMLTYKKASFDEVSNSVFGLLYEN